MEAFNFFKKLKETYAPIVQKELKEHGDNLGLQNVYTPINKIEEATGFRFLSVVDSNIKDIAVLFNSEFIEKIVNELNINYINNSKLVFFYDSQYDLNRCKNIVEDAEFIRKIKINIEFISIEEFANSKNIKDLEKVMAQKKFDIVFSNPPYNRNLDLKILEKIFNISKNIIFIHPAGFLIDKKFMTDLYNRIRNINYLENVNLFWGNELFNIGLFVPMCISKWNMEKNDKFCLINDNAFLKKKLKEEINSIHFLDRNLINIINSFSKNTNFISIYDKRVSEDYSNITDFSVKFATVRGHSHALNGWADDFFSLIALGNENLVDSSFRYSKNTNYSYYLLWSFNSENERNNFIKYCKTKFVRICLATRKFGQHLDTGELINIPWLDFTQEWNDAKLCKEFEISEELWNYIDNFIPDYYDDYKSGFEK